MDEDESISFDDFGRDDDDISDDDDDCEKLLIDVETSGLNNEELVFTMDKWEDKEKTSVLEDWHNKWK